MHPTRVTFPGSVRFAPKPPPAPASAKPADPAPPAWQDPLDEEGKPLRQVRNNDTKGVFKSTTVTVPAGKRMTYTEKPAPAAFGGRGRPTYTLTMIDETPAPVHHADLEHHAATKENPAHVVATSTKHLDENDTPLTAKGATAEDAVKFLAAAVAALEKKKTDADAAAAAKKKADDEKQAADVAKELHKGSKPPAPLVPRTG
jgi:hypothetical protein